MAEGRADPDIANLEFEENASGIPTHTSPDNTPDFTQERFDLEFDTWPLESASEIEIALSIKTRDEELFGSQSGSSNVGTSRSGHRYSNGKTPEARRSEASRTTSLQLQIIMNDIADLEDLLGEYAEQMKGIKKQIIMLDSVVAQTTAVSELLQRYEGHKTHAEYLKDQFADHVITDDYEKSFSKYMDKPLHDEGRLVYMDNDGFYCLKFDDNGKLILDDTGQPERDRYKLPEDFDKIVELQSRAFPTNGDLPEIPANFTLKGRDFANVQFQELIDIDSELSPEAREILDQYNHRKLTGQPIASISTIDDAVILCDALQVCAMEKIERLSAEFNAVAQDYDEVRRTISSRRAQFEEEAGRELTDQEMFEKLGYVSRLNERNETIYILREDIDTLLERYSSEEDLDFTKREFSLFKQQELPSSERIVHSSAANVLAAREQKPLEAINEQNNDQQRQSEQDQTDHHTMEMDQEGLTRDDILRKIDGLRAGLDTIHMSTIDQFLSGMVASNEISPTMFDQLRADIQSGALQEFGLSVVVFIDNKLQILGPDNTIKPVDPNTAIVEQPKLGSAAEELDPSQPRLAVGFDMAANQPAPTTQAPQPKPALAALKPEEVEPTMSTGVRA